jgi:raffinose/stachyose/melibiose transport system permease protein
MFYLGFARWNGTSPAVFTGLTNLESITTDSIFLRSLQNNLIWASLFLVFTNGLGLLLAGSLDIMGKKLSEFFRIILYTSTLLPAVVISYLFLALYEPQIGLFHSIFEAMGLNQLASTLWLGNPKLTIYAVLASSVWQYAAFPMLIFLAGFAGIEPSIYEAALIDGANEWQIFWGIKVPMIRPLIITILALTWIWNNMPFGPIYTMTKGGPGHASEVLVTYLYRLAFSGFELGYASTVGLILFVMVFPVVVVFVRVFER